MKYTFVVLHYLTYLDTIECVDSIINNVVINPKDSMSIIIVDNGSNNGSYDVLNEKYFNASNIRIIKSDRNLGFARGNNLGFKYAKYELDSDFIILINNDTLITQKSFLTSVCDLFLRYKYAVLGPDIVTKDGKHQNPFPQTEWTIQLLRRARMKARIKYLLVFVGLGKVLNIKRNKVSYEFVEKNMVDTFVHGACMIFSREFINKYDGLCEKTFLYMEEEILKLYLEKEELSSLYSPELQIFHKEDMSTKAVEKNSRKRQLRKIKNWIDSSYAYEEVYNEVQERRE